MHIRVVGWAPGAEGLPGVDHDVHHSARSSPSSHEGRMTTRPPAMTTGRWKSRQRSAQSSGISAELTWIGSSPATASIVSEVGQLALRAVDRVLDPAGPGLLLDPARRQLQQLGEHALGGVRAAADGEPDQAAGPSCGSRPQQPVAVGRSGEVRPRRACRRGARRARAGPRRARRARRRRAATCWSPRPPPRSAGQAEPVEHHPVAGLGAGRDGRPRSRPRASGPRSRRRAWPAWRGSGRPRRGARRGARSARPRPP